MSPPPNPMTSRFLPAQTRLYPMAEGVLAVINFGGPQRLRAFSRSHHARRQRPAGRPNLLLAICHPGPTDAGAVVLRPLAMPRLTSRRTGRKAERPPAE